MGDPRCDKALAAKRESKQIEFKEAFDVASKHDWCEITKDVVAIANSGGGAILFGVDSHGAPTGTDLTSLRSIDPATVCDRIQPYTGTQIADLEITELEKEGQKLLAWLVGAAAMPMVFGKPGTYPVDGGKQGTAFGRGTVYFRHGAKSEPGTSEDIARTLERKLESIRKEWLSGVRKIVHAPAGSRVALLPPDVRHSDDPAATPIRLTDDPAAPAYRIVDPDSTHPFRQKELVAEVRSHLPSSIEFNSFDVVAVRNVYGIDERREFAHKPRFGSRQYSPQFVIWLVEQASSDQEFFLKARAKHKQTDV
jgi:hypothetical protein